MKNEKSEDIGKETSFPMTESTTTPPTNVNSRTTNSAMCLTHFRWNSAETNISSTTNSIDIRDITGTSNMRKGESVTIFLTSPSTSDDEASEVDDNSFSSSKGMKRSVEFGKTQVENSEWQKEEPTKNVIVEKSFQSPHTTKVLSTDPILILKDRPRKPVLKSGTTSKEDKDIKITLDWDSIPNGNNKESWSSTYNQDNHETITSLSSSTVSNHFVVEHFESDTEENKDSNKPFSQDSSLVRFNITSNPMEQPVHKGSSSQVKFCFSDDQGRYHTFSPIDEMGNDIRSCHSSPCFASFDDPRMVVGSTTMEGKREPKKTRRRGSSPEDNQNKTSSNSFIKKELREWLFPSFLRRFSDAAAYNEDTSNVNEDTNDPKKIIEVSRSENGKRHYRDEDDSDVEMGDIEVKANTKANSLTNVAQISKVAVKADQVPMEIPRAAKKGKSSLAIAAAATSIMFSMPANQKDGNSRVMRGGSTTTIDEELELVRHRDLMARNIQKYGTTQGEDKVAPLPDRIFTLGLIALTALAIVLLFWFQNFGPGFTFKNIDQT